MNEASARLIDAFLAAFPEYVRGVAGTRGWTETDLGEAINSAVTWLRTELNALLSQPFGDQRRSPLELTQEATAIVGEALAAAGLEPPQRDEAVAQALPGDVYGLAPASSAELGEEAWEAHIAWGVAKAQAMKAQA
ncbi:MAG: hypothetical protein HKN93_06990, partial [Acidimicrobiia bacterium]|nr:hypothetical protein [Acidimicrobiia bacterium]